MDSKIQKVRQALQKNIPRTVFIPCDVEFLESLLSDGLFVRPNEVVQLENEVKRAKNRGSDDEEESFRPVDENEEFATELSFPSVEKAICKGIGRLGGAVVPKLYKVPSDATWVTYAQDLKCTDADQVMTLLKCSERVSKNVAEAKHSATVQPVIELREFLQVHPGGEFRCFVRDNVFLAATQRDISCSYRFSERYCNQIKQILSTFFESENVLFEDSLVVDVYIDEQQKVWVFDIENFETMYERSREDESVWGLFSNEEVVEFFQMRVTSDFPCIRVLDSSHELFTIGNTKWASGLPWELRNVREAGDALEIAISNMRRQQQEENLTVEEDER
eukprot:jgi/Galph1/3075/GphlegSOOS_G1722.1